MATRKEWDKTYREKHKEEIREYRKKNGARLEANRDPVKREASRQRYYEKTKERWLEYKRQVRQAVRDRNGDTTWWERALVRIENIVNRDRSKQNGE